MYSSHCSIMRVFSLHPLRINLPKLCNVSYTSINYVPRVLKSFYLWVFRSLISISTFLRSLPKLRHPILNKQSCSPVRLTVGQFCFSKIEWHLVLRTRTIFCNTFPFISSFLSVPLAFHHNITQSLKLMTL